MTPVPSSMVEVRAPAAASRGKGEVVDAVEGPVQPDVFSADGQVDGLVEHVGARAGFGAGVVAVVAEGEEAYFRCHDCMPFRLIFLTDITLPGKHCGR